MRIALAISVILIIAIPSFSQFSEFDSFDFQKADSVADFYNDYDLRDQKKLTTLLTKDLASDVEKFRAILNGLQTTFHTT